MNEEILEDLYYNTKNFHYWYNEGFQGCEEQSYLNDAKEILEQVEGGIGTRRS